MKVLVTGATGFVASHLIPRLSAAGHHVIAAGHDPARLERFSDAERLLWDLRQPPPPSLPDRLDFIIHLAQANVPFPVRAHDMFSVHVAATQSLLEIAHRAGVRRFVFTSTGSVYGCGGTKPHGGDAGHAGVRRRPAACPRAWSEADPADGSGYYAATKVAAERLIRAYGELVPHTIFRLFTPYGPGQTRRLIPNLVDRVKNGEPITVAGGTGPTFNPLFIDHVVDVLVQSLAAKGSQLLNLGGDEPLSVRAMAERIGRVVGRDPVLQDAAGTPDHVVGDISALRRVYYLPETPITFESGVRAMLAA